MGDTEHGSFVEDVRTIDHERSDWKLRKDNWCPGCWQKRLGGNRTGRLWDGLRWLRRASLWRNILLGQFLSVTIAGTGISAASLDDRGVNLPTTLNFLNYVTLCLYLFWVRRPLSLKWWKYLLYAMNDVEANFLVVTAFKYTSITSIMLLDCFSIPCAMLLSWLFVSARYNREHLAGVGLCLVGLALIIVTDSRKPAEGAEGEPSYAIKGDLLCIAGAFMYACSNVAQEYVVKTRDRKEFLGMVGLFGTLISGVQMMVLERGTIADVHYTPGVVAFIGGYVASLFTMYSWTTVFLQSADAAMFNLSLLTSDVYSMVFAYLVEGVRLSWLYFLAFGVIISGVLMYHRTPVDSVLARAQAGRIADDLNTAPGAKAINVYNQIFQDGEEDFVDPDGLPLRNSAQALTDLL